MLCDCRKNREAFSDSSASAKIPYFWSAESSQDNRVVDNQHAPPAINPAKHQQGLQSSIDVYRCRWLSGAAYNSKTRAQIC
jgi:hypothetical protein